METTRHTEVMAAITKLATGNNGEGEDDEVGAKRQRQN
jgi:hypothetical protein